MPYRKSTYNKYKGKYGFPKPGMLSTGLRAKAQKGVVLAQLLRSVRRIAALDGVGRYLQGSARYKRYGVRY